MNERYQLKLKDFKNKKTPENNEFWLLLNERILSYKVWQRLPNGEKKLYTGTFTSKVLDCKFGLIGYGHFKKALKQRDVNWLNDVFFRGLLEIAANAGQPVDQKRFPFPHTLIYAMEQNYKEETMAERTERIYWLIKQKKEQERTEFVNHSRKNKIQAYGGGRHHYTICTLTTPLYLAIKENNLDVVKALLKYGAKVRYEDPRVEHHDEDVKSVLKLINKLINKLIKSNTEQTTTEESQKKSLTTISALVKLQSYIEERTVESDLKPFKRAFNRAYRFFKPDPKYLPNKTTQAVGFDQDTGFAEDVKEAKLRLAEELKKLACSRNPEKKLEEWMLNLDSKEKAFIDNGRLGELCHAILNAILGDDYIHQLMARDTSKTRDTPKI